jgi:hypothetical protein
MHSKQMKKVYRVSITDKYPMDYNVEATSWATAIARGVREWQRTKGKGSRSDKLRITAVKTSPILKEIEE